MQKFEVRRTLGNSSFIALQLGWLLYQAWALHATPCTVAFGCFWTFKMHGRPGFCLYLHRLF
jgi:hypothetical protein